MCERERERVSTRARFKNAWYSMCMSIFGSRLVACSNSVLRVRACMCAYTCVYMFVCARDLVTCATKVRVGNMDTRKDIHKNRNLIRFLLHMHIHIHIRIRIRIRTHAQGYLCNIKDVYPRGDKIYTHRLHAYVHIHTHTYTHTGVPM